MAETSLRRHQVIQEEARKTLKRFLDLCSPFMRKDQRTHFRFDFSPESKTADYVSSLRDKIIAVLEAEGSTVAARERRQMFEGLRREALFYANCFLRILDATGHGQIPSQEDLNIL